MSELDRLREENARLRTAIKPIARMAAHALQGMYSAIAEEERLGLGWSDDPRDDVPMLTAAEAYLLAQFAEQEDAA